MQKSVALPERKTKAHSAAGHLVPQYPMRNPTTFAARVAGPSEADPATHKLTVNLDAARHRRLKQLAAEHRLSLEEILVAALDAHLHANIK